MSIQKHQKIRLTYLCHNLLQYYSHNLSETCLCLVSYVHSLSKTCCLPSASQQRWREHVHCTHDAFPESSIQSLTTISFCFRFTSGVQNSERISGFGVIFSNWKCCFRIQRGVLKLGVSFGIRSGVLEIGVKFANLEWAFIIKSEHLESEVSF